MERIRRITTDPWVYLPLLLEADPDEGMIGRYLEQGRTYVLEDDGTAAAVAVTVTLEDGSCELKNIAVDPKRQHRGYGSRLLRHVMAEEGLTHTWMYVGTTLPTEPFYAQLGFVYSHTVKNFFVDNYPEPIYEDGVQCVDMRYSKRRLQP